MSQLLTAGSRHDLTPQGWSVSSRVERKFLIPQTAADYVAALLRHSFTSDPDYASGRVNTIYLDTPALDFYDAALNGETEKIKVRVRWYGVATIDEASSFFVEIKTKDVVTGTKYRFEFDRRGTTEPWLAVTRRVLENSPLVNLMEDAGYRGPLAPVLRMSYERRRFNGCGQPVRLSLDTRLKAEIIDPLIVNRPCVGAFPGAVLEIKGDADLGEFARTLRTVGALSTAFSKYAASLNALTAIAEGVSPIQATGPAASMLYWA